jgi:hypothetical protein
VRVRGRGLAKCQPPLERVPGAVGRVRVPYLLSDRRRMAGQVANIDGLQGEFPRPHAIRRWQAQRQSLR